MSSATNALTNAQNQTQIQAVAVIKPDGQKHEQITNNSVPNANDTKAVQIKDDKNRGKSRSDKEKTGNEDEEPAETTSFSLISHEGIRAISQLQLDFKEYDKLLSTIKANYLKNDET